MWEKKGVSYFNTVNMLSYHFESSPNGRWIDLYIYLSLFITFFRILCFFQKIKTLLCRVAFVLWSPLVLPPTNPPGRVSEVHPEAVGPRMGEAWTVEHPTKSTRKTQRFTRKLTRKTETKNTSPFLEFWLSERLEILTARSFGSLGLRRHCTLEFQAFPTFPSISNNNNNNNNNKKKKKHFQYPKKNSATWGWNLEISCQPEAKGCTLENRLDALWGKAPRWQKSQHGVQVTPHGFFSLSINSKNPTIWDSNQVFCN